MRNKLIQYITIILVLVTITGGYFYFQSKGATQINSSQETKLTDGLIGYWSFDGNHMDWSAANEALDQVGSNDGNVVNATATTGKIGQALEFDGNGDYVSAVNSGTGGLDTITLSAWIKRSGASSTGYESIIETHNSNENEHYLVSNCNDNLIHFGFTIGYVATAVTISNSIITDGEWHHIAGVYDGDADRLYIYVDGTERNNAYANADVTGGNRMIVGGGAGYTGCSGFGDDQSWFNGKIDEPRIYNRALTQTEITELYSQGQTKINASQETKLTDGLTGYWTFDGNHMDWSISADEIRDQSISGYHGNASNNPTATIGKIGQALNFDSSSSQYINGTANTRDVLFGPRIGTLSLWMKPAGVPVSANTWVENLPGAVTEINNAGFGVFRGNFEGSGDKIWATNSWEQTANLSFDFNLGEWVHVAWRLDDTNACLYKNGVQSSCIPHSSRYSTGDMNIGRGYLNYFDGDIDEVRTYNRALTDSEISQLYNLGQVKINSSQDTKLTDGLVGNWTFDGNHMDWSQSAAEARDQSGQSIHLDVTNMDSSSAAIGKIGQALNFDGVSGTIIEDGGSDVLGGLETITMTAWVKRSGGTATGYESILCTRGDANGPYISSNCNGDNELEFGVIEGYVNSKVEIPNSIITDGEWHHIAGVYDGDIDIIYLYVDGAEQDRTTGVTTDLPAGARFIIGANNWASNNCSGTGANTPFNGQIDEVRIYNRALTASEVSQLYMMGK